VPQHCVSPEKEPPADQTFCELEGNSIMDRQEPEPLQIKEEQDGHLVLKEEIDSVTVTSAYEESDESEAEGNSKRNIFHSYLKAANRDQEGSWQRDWGPTSKADPMPRYKHMSYSNDTSSESPVNARTSDGSIGCQLCGKTFGSNADLKEHFKIHIVEKPFSCNSWLNSSWAVQPLCSWTRSEVVVLWMVLGVLFEILCFVADVVGIFGDFPDQSAL
ncbi:hypothetical protein XENOCAPTIV_007313, partial [Xenoophorus captivus]